MTQCDAMCHLKLVFVDKHAEVVLCPHLSITRGIQCFVGLVSCTMHSSIQLLKKKDAIGGRFKFNF